MDGLILIDKPVGITSHDVVNRARRAYNTRRIGHAGTLDPFATGLLILGINKGTKSLTALVGLDKTYIATAHLGAITITDDTEGDRIETPLHTYIQPTEADVLQALDSFLGVSEQITPLYSAKKIGGKKMYELARLGLGETVERPKKNITIYSIGLVTYHWPELVFQVTCSSGTYIRALARDLGERLKCGAYLTGLRRTCIGAYRIEDSTTLDALPVPCYSPATDH
ncbi:tRNA pseudouridine(55) synthase TruB [Candidatus Uhrbacteria bacterium]|nr:tRNA pseudouridine(55) synthase TruB [Candidatus Uhrbacteria bacterium]